MSSDNLCRMSAVQISDLIARKAVSPVEVVDAAISRAEQVQPVLNAFATNLFDQARSAAKIAEKAVTQGDTLGPLHGVPVTVKDNVAIEGVPLLNGSLSLKGNISPGDAAVVSRLREAGAIFIATTTLPEFAHKILTDSKVWGVTRNPYDLERTPGGSSGGASASLASEVTALAVGTDGGGSVRCPAAWTNTIGLKPTVGRVPFEKLPDGFNNYATIGPMTRTAADASLMLSVMSGHHKYDPYSTGGPGPSQRYISPISGKKRIAWISSFGSIKASPEVSKLNQALLGKLEAEGAIVEPVETPIFDNVFEDYVVVATTAHAARLGPVDKKWGDQLTLSLRHSIARGLGYSAADWQVASDQRSILYRAVQDLFEAYDFIATPAMTTEASALDAGGSIASESYGEQAGFLYPFNLTGHPCISVPSGFTKSGLPVGIQFVGPYFSEESLLSMAAMTDDLGGWSKRYPPAGFE